MYKITVLHLSCVQFIQAAHQIASVVVIRVWVLIYLITLWFWWQQLLGASQTRKHTCRVYCDILSWRKWKIPLRIGFSSSSVLVLMQLSRLKNSSCLQAYCKQNINIQIFKLTPLNSPGCKLYNGILVCYNIFKIQVQVSRFPRVGRLQEKARSHFNNN